MMHHSPSETDLLVLGEFGAIPSRPPQQNEAASVTGQQAFVSKLCREMLLDGSRRFPLMGNNYTLGGFFTDF